MEDEEYILIIAQEANFQSRSILVPKKEFLEDEERKKEYEILRESVRDFQESLEKYLTNEKLASLRNIKGLLIQNIVWERNEKGKRTIGHHEETWSNVHMSQISHP